MPGFCQTKGKPGPSSVYVTVINPDGLGLGSSYLRNNVLALNASHLKLGSLEDMFWGFVVVVVAFVFVFMLVPIRSLL